MKTDLRALAGLTLMACMSSAMAEEGGWLPTLDVEAGMGHDSNVTRGLYERDIVDDTLATASLAAAWNHEFGAMSAATLRAFAEAEQFSDVDTLNRTTFGVQGMYRWQNALGFTVPFYQISATLLQDDAETRFREAERAVTQAFMTRRITDAFRLSLGVEASVQEAKGKVFDLEQARVFANGDLQLNESWATYGTYSLIKGDTVSSAQQQFCNGALAADTYELIVSADELEPDTALNEALCGSWLAYRLPALTHVFVLGVNRGFGHHLSFDASVQHVLVFAEEGGHEYQRTIARAGILARF
ncbi:MAG: hypothetical protein ACOY33_04250 [Pseudomonadota bacterium]